MFGLFMKEHVCREQEYKERCERLEIALNRKSQTERDMKAFMDDARIDIHKQQCPYLLELGRLRKELADTIEFYEKRK